MHEKSLPEEVFGVISLSSRSTGMNGIIPKVPYFLISRCVMLFLNSRLWVPLLGRGMRGNFVNLDCDQELQTNTFQPMS